MFCAPAVDACQDSTGSSLGEGRGEPPGAAGFGPTSSSAPLPADRAPRSDDEINVVIALDRSCKILQASPEWLAEFDFSSDEALGRTLQLIQGPMTDSSSLASLFENARWGKAAENAVTFYSRNGQGTLYNVRARCVAVPTSREPSALTMSFIKSEAVSWKKATEEDGLAKVLVEAAAPCRTVHVSSELADLYDMLPQELLGRTLNIIQGPSTDRSKWASLLHAGQRGISSRAVISTSTRHCRKLWTEIAVYPVIGTNGGLVHLLLIFSDIDNIPALPSNLGPAGGESQVEARPMSHKSDARRVQYSHELHPTEVFNQKGSRQALPLSQTAGAADCTAARQDFQEGCRSSRLDEETARRVRISDPALTEPDLRGESTAIFFCALAAFFAMASSRIKMFMPTIDTESQMNRSMERGADRRDGKGRKRGGDAK